jgi:hypothetical protein
LQHGLHCATPNDIDQIIDRLARLLYQIDHRQQKLSVLHKKLNYATVLFPFTLFCFLLVFLTAVLLFLN